MRMIVFEMHVDLLNGPRTVRIVVGEHTMRAHAPTARPDHPATKVADVDGYAHAILPTATYELLEADAAGGNRWVPYGGSDGEILGALLRRLLEGGPYERLEAERRTTIVLRDIVPRWEAPPVENQDNDR